MGSKRSAGIDRNCMKLQDAEERRGDDDVPCNTNSLRFILGALRNPESAIAVVNVTFNSCVSFTNTKNVSAAMCFIVPIYAARLFGYK